MSDRLVRVFATVFSIGNIPVAPGTAATLAGALLAVMLNQAWGFYGIFWLVITVLGFKVSGRMEELMGEKDPGCVVIDEVSGVMIAFFLLPLNWAAFWSAFFLFRAFDMFKIYPAGRFEAQGGARGIMMDDIAAGLYTFVIMQIAIRVAGIF